jgi:hypothetical protein
MKGIQKHFKSPFFVSMVTTAKFVDVDVTGNITAKLCEVEVNLTFFAPWLPWQRPPFFMKGIWKGSH